MKTKAKAGGGENMKFQNIGFFLKALGLGTLLRQYPKGLMEMARLKSAIYYLRLVQGVRSGYIILFQITFRALFLLTGLILMHVAFRGGSWPKTHVGG